MPAMSQQGLMTTLSGVLLCCTSIRDRRRDDEEAKRQFALSLRLYPLLAMALSLGNLLRPSVQVSNGRLVCKGCSKRVSYSNHLSSLSLLTDALLQEIGWLSVPKCKEVGVESYFCDQ